MARATTSFPVPVSPSNKTVAEEAAACLATVSWSLICLLVVTIGFELGVDFLAKRLDLAVKGDGIESLVDDDGEMVGGERLRHKIEGAELHGLDSEFDGSIGREHDDQRGGVRC